MLVLSGKCASGNMEIFLYKAQSIALKHIYSAICLQLFQPSASRSKAASPPIFEEILPNIAKTIIANAVAKIA